MYAMYAMTASSFQIGKFDNLDGAELDKVNIITETIFCSTQLFASDALVMIHKVIILQH